MPRNAAARSSGKHIVYLATDAYGGRGGIALYSRYVIDAMRHDPDVGKITVLPRIAGNGSDPIPADIDWRIAASRSNAAYLSECLKLSLFGRPIDAIYCSHVNLIPLATMMQRLCGASVLATIHGFEAWDPFTRKSSITGLARVDRIVSVSQYSADRFFAWSNYPREKIVILPNTIRHEDFGVRPKRADLVNQYGLDGKSVIALCGRMDASERRKGFDELIEAFPDILVQRPEAHLLLMGDGNDMARLQAKIDGLDLTDHASFTGFVPEQEKADYYCLADAFVMPSRQEGFGFVHLEAMACGVPTVASIADGSQDAVLGGQIGDLCDPESRQSIVDAALKALDRPKGVPEGLDFFRFERYAERVKRLIDGLAPSRR